MPGALQSVQVTVVDELGAPNASIVAKEVPVQLEELTLAVQQGGVFAVSAQFGYWTVLVVVPSTTWAATVQAGFPSPLVWIVPVRQF